MQRASGQKPIAVVRGADDDRAARLVGLQLPVGPRFRIERQLWWFRTLANRRAAGRRLHSGCGRRRRVNWPRPVRGAGHVEDLADDVGFLAAAVGLDAKRLRDLDQLSLVFRFEN